jgi:hypothetical protein
MGFASRRLMGIAGATFLALGMALTSVVPAAAGGQPFECSGAFTGTTAGNLVVPTGKFCIILGATVGGNVLVMPDAIGFHSHGSTIHGSVLSPHPIVFDIRVLASTVDKSVEVANTRAGTAGGICRSKIGGDVRLQNNAGLMNVGIGFPFDVCFAGNTIAGNVIADSSSGVYTINHNQVGAGVHVDSNTGLEILAANKIAHTLECEDNNPPPVSTGNTAENFVGQCTS